MSGTDGAGRVRVSFLKFVKLGLLQPASDVIFLILQAPETMFHNRKVSRNRKIFSVMKKLQMYLTGCY